MEGTSAAQRVRGAPDRLRPLAPPRLRTTTILHVARPAGAHGRLRTGYELAAQRRCRPVRGIDAAGGAVHRPVWAGAAAPRQNGSMSTDSPTAEHPDTFGAKADLTVGDRTYTIFNITAPALTGRYDIQRLPYAVKVLLENLLRHEDGPHVSAADIVAVADWGSNPEGHGQGAGDSAHEIAFTPERVLMQDFTGVPGVVDLAAMPRRAGPARGQRLAGQPPRAGRARDRPLGHHRALGRRVRLRHQRLHRVRAQHGALPAAALGPRCLPGLPSRAARHGDLPPGQPRVPVAPRLRHRGRPRLLRHAGGHRLAHGHGQRARRARVGRRGNRGRGGHARPAAVHAAATGRGAADLR